LGEKLKKILSRVGKPPNSSSSRVKNDFRNSTPDLCDT